MTLQSQRFQLSRYGRRTAIVGHDFVMVLVAWLLAFMVPYNLALPDAVWPAFWQSLIVVAAVQSLLLWRQGLYKGMWRFASIPDLWNILRAVAYGTLGAVSILFIANRMDSVPRTSLVFFPVFLTILLGAPRLLYRMWKEHRFTLPYLQVDAKRVLVLGAGRAGEMLVREMRRDDAYLPVGFLDDSAVLKGNQVQGLPILGGLEQLNSVIDEIEVELVIIAMPSLSGDQMRRVVELCEDGSAPFQTLPDLQGLRDKRVSVSELREVSIEDLLGRETVSLDWQAISADLSDKRILVSGGGGSIGSELCRQLAALGPSRLIVFENNEYNLYQIERELRLSFPDLPMEAVLGDVREPIAVEHVFERVRPQVVFHAAAYKHVPMLEGQATEAVRNNVLGTKLMADTADQYQVDTFVMISSDKAVHPANVMGASKRIAEIYCQGLSKRSSTRFLTVRFGNVLGSTGSVVPLFRKQIAAGGPVTVTHPEITRFFMTIPEACQLIMQAAVMGQGGEIFVLEMGAPIKIRYLAEQMIRLSGKSPGGDVQIVYTGLRPGEKMYEELFYDQESLAETPHRKILLASSSSMDWGEFCGKLSILIELSSCYDEKNIRARIWEMVPERAVAPVPVADADVISFGNPL